MRQWRNLLGGLLLWAAHFFAVYIVASVFPGTRTAAVLVTAITLVMLAITSWLAVKALRTLHSAAGGLDRWMNRLSLFGYALAGVAIIYQGLPAVLL